MYKGYFNQEEKNSCGAATLVIAAVALDLMDQDNLISDVDKIYNEVRDKDLSIKLGITVGEVDKYVTPPKNILSKAKDLGLQATPYLTSDINLDMDDLAPLKIFKEMYIDNTTPAPEQIEVEGLKGLVRGDTYLQMLVYLNGDPKQTHWVLLQINEKGSPLIYDTAFGSNIDADWNFLRFNASFDTGRPNNFLGYAILLQKA